MYVDPFLQFPGGKLHLGAGASAYTFQRVSQGGVLGVNSQQTVVKLDS
jgi:hypothetical protein